MASTEIAVLDWTTPPSSQRGKKANDELLRVLAEVRENASNHPGEWALIAEGRKDSGIVSRINQGRVVGIEAGEFEATSRSRQNGDGRVFDIYVRPKKRRGRPKGSTTKVAGATKKAAAKKAPARKT